MRRSDAMVDALVSSFDAGQFMPHGMCLLWRPSLVGLHLVSDALIGLAYLSIPIAIVHFMRQRQDMVFGWIFRMFALFITVCGLTHLMSIWVLWNPDYFAEGLLKAGTAGVSVATAILLWPLIPRAVALPSPGELRRANAELQGEVERHRETAWHLRESESRFRAVVEADPQQIVVLDEQQRIREVFPSRQPVLHDLLGRGYSRRCRDVLPGDAAATLEAAASAALNEQVTQECEFAVAASGETSWFWSSLTPMTWEGREGVLWRSIDVTEQRRDREELRRTADQLQRSNAELDQFAYVASHDLRAPLRAIDNLSRWLEEDLGPKLDEDAREQMVLMRDRVRRMNALIEGLLAYSRAARGEPELRSVDCAELLAEAASLAGVEDGFRLEVPAGLPSFTTAREPLLHVLRNLLENAVKHHDRDEGVISVRCRELEGWYEFEIADDGPGIAAEYREKVFGMFETLKPMDAVEGSTGIGLAQVKKVVERFGGRIEVDEGAGSRGAVFRFTWPMSMG